MGYNSGYGQGSQGGQGGQGGQCMQQCQRQCQQQPSPGPRPTPPEIENGFGYQPSGRPQQPYGRPQQPSGRPKTLLLRVATGAHSSGGAIHVFVDDKHAGTLTGNDGRVHGGQSYQLDLQPTG